MSGSTGADRVKSRQDFQQFLLSYRGIISKFPGFRGITPSGSYNSDPSKNDFGDIDLITHIESTKDKKAVKNELVAFFDAMPDDVVVPFTSEKHAGRKTYNSGELVTVRYHDKKLGYSAQIDNIIALSQVEAGFKQQFLDMPAEMQGLVLGLVKVATLETKPSILFQKLGIKSVPALLPNQEYEFNLSSVELQLRVNTYEPGSYKQIKRDIIWRSTDFNDVQKLLYQYILNTSFDVLLDQVKQTIKNPRSSNRIMGVFGSMITVKSGEVGTPKGDNKISALNKIKHTLSEYKNIELLSKVKSSLVESGEHGSTIVMAFGRFQPPTTGHGLLVNTVMNLTRKYSCDSVIYVSRTVDPKKNPLPLNIKLQFLKKMFPVANFVGADEHVRTFMEAAISLNKKYKNLIMVAGSDRAEAYTKLLNQYNHKEFEYDSIKVMSSGYRDPDSEEVSGMSGTKMREAAIQGDFGAFRTGLPKTLSNEEAKKLMLHVQTGSQAVPKVKAQMRAKELTEEVVDQNTWYFFDLKNANKEFTPLQLKVLGLRDTRSGKWFYRAGSDTTPLLLKNTLTHLSKVLGTTPKAWSPAAKTGIEEGWKQKAGAAALATAAAIGGAGNAHAGTFGQDLLHGATAGMIDAGVNHIQRHLPPNVRIGVGRMPQQGYPQEYGSYEQEREHAEAVLNQANTDHEKDRKLLQRITDPRDQEIYINSARTRDYWSDMAARNTQYNQAAGVAKTNHRRMQTEMVRKYGSAQPYNESVAVKPFSQVKQYPLTALLTGQGDGTELKRSPEYRRDNQVQARRTAMKNRTYSNGHDEGDWDN